MLWFIAALILAGLELAVGEFTLLMLAGGALAGGLLELVGAPLWLSVAAFGLASIGLILFLRPYLRRRLHSPTALDTSDQALIGSSAEVLETVNQHGGQIRLEGSIWSARSMVPGENYSIGETVNVASFDGPTAIVWKKS